MGYRSRHGTNRAPSNQDDWDDTDVDEQEQADCYEALFSQLWFQRDWLEELYWWNWEVDPDPTWEADNWFTPQHKPAEGVIAKYYTAPDGDLDLDGDVDRDDLGVFLGAYDTPAPGRSDLDHDGDGDRSDQAVFLGAYGTEAGAGQGAPEPATLMLLAFGGLAATRQRRR